MDQEELRQELYSIYRKYIESGKQLDEMSAEDTERVEELRKILTYEQLNTALWAAFGL